MKLTVRVLDVLTILGLFKSLTNRLNAKIEMALEAA